MDGEPLEPNWRINIMDDMQRRIEELEQEIRNLKDLLDRVIDVNNLYRE